MNTFSFTASVLAQSFSYALLYSLWQGGIVYALLFVLLRAFPGANARTKYFLSFNALAVIFLWFADTWINQYSKLRGTTIYISEAVTSGAFSGVAHPVSVTAATVHGLDILSGYLPRLERFVPAILCIYCIGLAFMLLRFVVNIVQLRSLSVSGVSLPENKWSEFVSRWQYHFGIPHNVRLLLSRRVNVPMMLGTLKPIILLPVATISSLSTEQVEAILLHELAHIKRYDYLFNLLQTAVETILFFNPFVWLMSSVIRREREHCCDDLVLSSAADPFHYAKALALIEDHRINSNSLALAATGNRKQLFHRIKRIMEMKKENNAQSRLSALVVAVIVTTFFGAMIVFTPSFAQKAKDDKNAVQKKTYKTVTVDDGGKKKVVTKTIKGPVGGKDDEDDVDIKISVNDDDRKNATARIVVINHDDDKKGSGKNRIKKEIVISGNGKGGGSFDGDQLEAELARAKAEMDNVDWEEIREEISTAMAEAGKQLDIDKLKKEISIEIRKEMENSKAEMEKARKEIEKSKKIIASASSAAHARAKSGATIVEVSSSSNDVEDMLDKMQKDGLIDRSTKFRIEKKGDELYINGNKQSKQVLEKYSNYLNGKEVTVKGGKGNLNININN